ncbi:Crp/Fnr family transcriptional regulator [Romboutsia sp. 1001285H_161024_C4]|uniref:Crp/Fnr family transcriptional regulator n=1 Tax=Romboutsia sp. 1001285H_161024_C4 TaxID=2787109 RepID=UPI001898EC58|nr:Crp/Fnr family transcriptional regulator [Romboutsia sp. 1001285H_161024_C4]
MQDGVFSNYIEDKYTKEFISKIPNNIKNKCEILKIEKEKTVALKGENIKDIYISLNGKMQVRNEFENGFVYSFADVDSIAYIGVMEIMANKQAYSSTLKTITDCIMLKISTSDFIKWIKLDQDLTLKVLHFVSKSMYEQSLNKGEVLAYPAVYSLINYLIDIFESEEKDVVYIYKTREEIGSVLGFSIRTINRNLKELKEENLICVSRKYISINKEQFYKLLNKLDSIKRK